MDKKLFTLGLTVSFVGFCIEYTMDTSTPEYWLGFTLTVIGGFMIGYFGAALWDAKKQ